MSNQRNRAFRLSFIRRRIITLCRSRALRAALLAELNGGPDAALVVEMVERARLPTRLPTQVVTPMPQQNGEEARAEEPNPPVQPVSPPRQERPNPPVQPVSPPRQERPDAPTHVETPPQEEVTDSVGHSVATAVIIVDSDSDSD